MSWRTVIISNRAKLDLKMGYLVVRGEETQRVLLDEIAILIIENPAVSLAGCLIEALAEKKVKTVFCNSVKLYTRSVFEAINDCDISKIRFYEFPDKKMKSSFQYD